MSRWDECYLGRDKFPETLSSLEIERFFTPNPQELEVIRQRRGDPNRIAFSLQLGFLKMTGRSLNSVELVPPSILEIIGEEIGCAVPRIASIRALYRRRRTLFDHQSGARKLLGRIDFSAYGERALTTYLRREAIGTYSVQDLSDKARVWLVEHNYLLPRDRDIRRLSVRALRFQEQALFKSICQAADDVVRSTWPARLLELSSQGDSSHLAWLLEAPTSKSMRGLDDQLAKITFLRSLGAEKPGLDVVPLVGLEYFSRQMMMRKPAALSSIPRM